MIHVVSRGAPLIEATGDVTQSHLRVCVLGGLCCVWRGLELHAQTTNHYRTTRSYGTGGHAGGGAEGWCVVGRAWPHWAAECLDTLPSPEPGRGVGWGSHANWTRIGNCSNANRGAHERGWETGTTCRHGTTAALPLGDAALHCRLCTRRCAGCRPESDSHRIPSAHSSSNTQLLDDLSLCTRAPQTVSVQVEYFEPMNAEPRWQSSCSTSETK